jgi:hypothetical protein
VLACDGVWDVIEPEQLATTINAQAASIDPSAPPTTPAGAALTKAAEDLVTSALAAGSRDNISAVLVDLREVGAARPPAPGAGALGGSTVGVRSGAAPALAHSTMPPGTGYSGAALAPAPAAAPLVGSGSVILSPPSSVFSTAGGVAAATTWGATSAASGGGTAASVWGVGGTPSPSGGR